mmetsp:Transcript_39048/g.112784  ORF Transcript_39048/g.112784 Transcript_39048/m.112784 type:complete len:379 (-) Transcript_39048:64-1200(-)
MGRRLPAILVAAACVPGAFGSRISSAHASALADESQWSFARLGMWTAAGLNAEQAPPSKKGKASQPGPRAMEPTLTLQDLPASWRRRLAGRLKPEARNRFESMLGGAAGYPAEDEAVWAAGASVAENVVLPLYTAERERSGSRAGLPLPKEVEAGTLQDRVIGKSFEEVSFATRIRLFAEVLHAVDDMNRMGVVHGRVSPDRVLVLGDCSAAGGLDSCCAVICDSDGKCSLPGGLFPSAAGDPPARVAPEARATQTLDVWALGILLYGLLSGKQAGKQAQPVADFDALFAKLEVHLQEQFAQPVAVKEAVPRLIQLVRRMVQPDPALRIPTSAALRELQQIANDCRLDIRPKEALPWSTEERPSRLRTLVRRLFRRGP